MTFILQKRVYASGGLRKVLYAIFPNYQPATVLPRTASDRPVGRRSKELAMFQLLLKLAAPSHSPVLIMAAINVEAFS